MIAVAVRQENQIHAFQRGQFLFALVEARIGQPRVEQQNVAGRRDDFERGMSIPGELSIRHAEDESENTLAGKRNDWEKEMTNDEWSKFGLTLKDEGMTRFQMTNKSGRG
jgi:hypothetical protein